VKVFVAVFLLVLFIATPVATLRAEPFCDVALESGKFVDWLVCMVFAMIIGDGWGDYQGNWYLGG
jgi:hypothetical protein